MFIILVDNGTTLNVLPISTMRKVSKKKSGILPTDLIIAIVYGTIAQPVKVLSIEHIVG